MSTKQISQQTENRNIFQKMGLPSQPVILAPLAGVSDHPFRRVCTELKADLTYVEMISATALNYESKKTYEMLKRHESEEILGVQITGRNADDTASAVAILNKLPFETIDINMGCPVKKVVKTGCGSAILKDPARVYETVKKCKEATDKPLSVKIRLGWDRQMITAKEVADAAEKGGADWLVVHGRTRADDYSVPVDLEGIAALKQQLSIPVIGNGNLFCESDVKYMKSMTSVDGVMISRGALGNPWIFESIKFPEQPLSLDDWLQTVMKHLDYQMAEYGATGSGHVCMRKHLLWYAKGWPGVKSLKDKINTSIDLNAARQHIAMFAEEMLNKGHLVRTPLNFLQEGRFQWDPKWDMDRKLDRGVGTDGLEAH